ncbi:unnamed protein product, partial [Prorocentrum cordatum]
WDGRPRPRGPRRDRRPRCGPVRPVCDAAGAGEGRRLQGGERGRARPGRPP